MIEKIISKVLIKLGEYLFRQLWTYLQEQLQEYLANKLKDKLETSNTNLKKPATRLEGNSQNEDVLGSFS